MGYGLEDEWIMTFYLKMMEQDGAFTSEMFFAALTVLGYILVLAVATVLPKTVTPFMTTLLPNVWLCGIILLVKRRAIIEAMVLKKISAGLLIVAFGASIAIVVFCLRSQTFSPIKQSISVSEGKSLAALFIVILVPMAEEIFFRGYLFRLFSQHFDKWSAILLVSILFSFLHLHSDTHFLMFCFSCLLCLLVSQTGNLVSAIVTHVSWNAIDQIATIPSMPVRWFIVIAAITGIAITVHIGVRMNGLSSNTQ